MSSKQQMKRGKNQSLYKYLPETWIDFSVRGKERKQYIAKVVRWNSEKLDGINAKRLIRTVNESVHSFENQAASPGLIKPTVGFGADDKYEYAEGDVVKVMVWDNEMRPLSDSTFTRNVIAK